LDSWHQDGGCGAADLENVPHPVAARALFILRQRHLDVALDVFDRAGDDGMMSKSKISVGSHSVAQAFGTSTTPEIWPWQGAVPRIE